jgi:hypothetical protein
MLSKSERLESQSARRQRIRGGSVMGGWLCARVNVMHNKDFTLTVECADLSFGSAVSAALRVLRCGGRIQRSKHLSVFSVRHKEQVA